MLGSLLGARCCAGFGVSGRCVGRGCVVALSLSLGVEVVSALLMSPSSCQGWHCECGSPSDPIWGQRAFGACPLQHVEVLGLGTPPSVAWGQDPRVTKPTRGVGPPAGGCQLPEPRSPLFPSPERGEDPDPPHGLQTGDTQNQDCSGAGQLGGAPGGPGAFGEPGEPHPPAGGRRG